MIEFANTPEGIHHCTSYREGDHIIWRYPLCPDYERRYNIKTCKMQVNRGGSSATHTGSSDSRQNLEALTQNVSNN